ncbi:MAG: cytochrome c biogenesis protein CcsA [Terrimicrobiaceae bacterium]|nr:cytochrome c biogenesis protein CcsA [Terrimicrobiaceae bacterium]
MERYWLAAAAFCFLLSFGHTLFALGSGTFRPGRFNLATMAAGFAFATGFLYQRGQVVGSCPITNLFEVLVFLTWSIVLIYLVVGPTYRLSLMGAFTAPLVLGLLLFALVSPIDAPAPRATHNPWVEFHAALSIIAYGAFGLASIAGVMYLVQERQLKSRRVSELLLNLPPITDLGAVNSRLLFTGFLLLTVAFAAGVAAGLRVTGLKAGASLFVWALYGTLLALTHLRLLPARRIAAGSVVVFLIALLTLPSVSHLSAR